MALSDFTSFEDVRAALGVTEDELSDTTLDLRLYEYTLKADLERVDANLVGNYTAALALPNPNTAQIRLVESTKVFSTYAVARHLLAALPMFAFKEVTDGKASDTRFALDPYKATTERVEALFLEALSRVKEAAAGLSPGAAPVVRRSFMAVASPASDPVRGT